MYIGTKKFNDIWKQKKVLNYQTFLNRRPSDQLLVSLELLQKLERIAVLVLTLLLQLAGDPVLRRIKGTLKLVDGGTPLWFCREECLIRTNQKIQNRGRLKNNLVLISTIYSSMYSFVACDSRYNVFAYLLRGKNEKLRFKILFQILLWVIW